MQPATSSSTTAETSNKKARRASKDTAAPALTVPAVGFELRPPALMPAKVRTPFLAVLVLVLLVTVFAGVQLTGFDDTLLDLLAP